MVRVLGVPVTDLPETEIFELCQQFLSSSTPHTVITAGPEFVMRVRRDSRLQEIVETVDLVTPDGIGVVLAAKWYGRPLAGRVTGVDLALRLVKYAAHRGLRVYILGAAEDSLRRALQMLHSQYPRLHILGRNGYFTSDRTDEVVQGILAFRPHLLLVGLGQPRQELFLYEYQPTLRIPLAIGVGGAIDVIGGTVRRAPKWVQDLHLEWLYRLIKEPARWRRQLELPRFALAAWQDARKSQE